MKMLKLCLVTNLKNQSFESYRPFLLKAVQGGITSLQLREKTNDLAQFRKLACDIKKVLKPFGVSLIINDHVAIAKDIDADGVHIGQSDISPQEARNILGAGKVIGLSIETLAQLEGANQLDCIDYVAASAVFPSKTKPDCKTIWRLDGLHTLAQQSRYPVVAIGGINRLNVAEVMAHGACGAAVIGAIHDHPDPAVAASDMIRAMDGSFNERRASCFRK